MKIKFLIPLVLVLFMGSVVHADESRGNGYFKSKKWQSNKDEMIKQMHQELDITKTQRNKLNQNRAKFRKIKENLYNQIQSAEDALNSELQKSKQDTKKIDRLHNQIKSLRMKQSDQRLESIQDVRRILTPEQFEKFMELKKVHRRGSR